MYFILGILLFYSFYTYTNYKFLVIRTNKKKIIGTVKEYRKAKIKKRNDYTKIEYPFVEYTNSSGQKKLKMLRLASSSKRYFEIGEQVEVFEHDPDLLYWNSLDTWFDKLTPAEFLFKLLHKN